MSSVFRIEIGSRIRQARYDFGWTQQRLADYVKMDRGYLSKIEDGLVNARLDTFIKLGSALDLSAGDLFGE